MSKKQKSPARKGSSKSYRRWGVPLAIIAFLIIIIMAYFASQSARQTPYTTWNLDSGNKLIFDKREPVGATSTVIESTANYTVEKIVYRSFGENVYALLRVPTNVEKPPVVIVLPAASVNKSADADMAKALASWGYASLTLDERGNNGETPGSFAGDLSSGYQAFISSKDPVQYKQINDVLQGYEFVKSRNDLDSSRTAVLGESMGGRFAIISAAIEPGIKGVFVISSGPYGLTLSGNPAEDQFTTSVEPRSYLSVLPPRKLVMIHFTDDQIIHASEAKALYDQAGEPKEWYEYNGSVHGVYSDIFAKDLRAELKLVLG